MIDKLSKKILKEFNKTGYIPINSFPNTSKDDITRCINNLDNIGFIERSYTDSCQERKSYYLPHKVMPIGKDYLENRISDIIRFWYPHVIATAALIISIIALLKR